MSKESIIRNFGNRLRLRVCGLCIQDDKVLLVKHKSLGEKGYLWAPPGGGVNYGESVEEALKREFLEETGLEINISRFLFVSEYLDVPLHALELLFKL
jgi:8-oxo-dGTP diphosphatase